jgi:hypothetical protein
MNEHVLKKVCGVPISWQSIDAQCLKLVVVPQHKEKVTYNA